MLQDTIPHSIVTTTEIPQAKPAEESQSESHIVEVATSHSSGDSLQTAIPKVRENNSAQLLDDILWNTDSTSAIGVLFPQASETDSLKTLQSFITENKMFGSEPASGRYGMSGDPIPFNLRSDSILASSVILLTLIMFYSIMRAKKFFGFQIKNFFRTMREDSSLAREAASDTRNLIFMTLYGVVVLGLVFFFYTKEHISTTYITYSEYTLMGIYLGEIGACVFGEIFLEKFVNSIFFPKPACIQWMTSKMFVYALGGIALMPLLLLISFFGLQADNSAIYALIVLGIVKILSFYKTFNIFFKKIGSFLQFFLYLCTLEIIPTLLIWVVLLLTANYLKVDY